MAVERKCSFCGCGNSEADFCKSCGQVLSPQLIEEEREAERERVRNSIIPDRIDLFLEAWKHSPFFLVRWTYYIVYSVAAVFFSIAFLFAYFVVGLNG